MKAKAEKEQQAGNQEAAQSEPAPGQPFSIRDCALITLATGISVQTLREFREGLLIVHPGSIYHHFWGRLLEPHFDEPEYNNDFAAWASHSLHDRTLAERLSVIEPIEFDNIEDLRVELVDTVEARLDESELVAWTRADQQFHFVRAQIVIWDTTWKIVEPAELVRVLPILSPGSIYYHFIDARRRTEEKSDDFTAWLSGYGPKYEDLVGELLAVDPYFSSLKELRYKISDIFRTYFEEGRP